MKITFDVNDKHISIDLVALDLVFGGDTSVYSLSFVSDKLGHHIQNSLKSVK